MIFDSMEQFRSLLPEESVLRAQENSTTSLALDCGAVVSDDSGLSGGISASVRRGGFLGFSARSGFRASNVEAVLQEALENAGKGCSDRAVPPLPSIRNVNRMEQDDTTRAEKLAFLHALDAYILAHGPKVQARYISLDTFATEKKLICDNGTASESYFIRYTVYVSLTGEAADGDSVSVDMLDNGSGSLRSYLRGEAAVFRKLDRLIDALDRKRHGVFVTPGEKTCILGFDPAIMLVHEAIGHTVEADLVMGGSIAGRYLGKPVASELITLGDFAHDMNGLPVPQPIYVDDEGTPARDAMIIENGILTGYMHDRDSAAACGVTPTGNGRAFSYSDDPLIRMRNTAILPGSSTFEEMISATDDGLYLVQAGMGQADTTGEFMIMIVEGYEIKNGKLGNAIRDTVCSGYAFPVMSSVDMVGDTVGWDIGGMCGKGQPMVTGGGSPLLRCRLKIGGN